jgi:hypothetical protein
LVESTRERGSTFIPFQDGQDGRFKSTGGTPGLQEGGNHLFFGNRPQVLHESLLKTVERSEHGGELLDLWLGNKVEVRASHHIWGRYAQVGLSGQVCTDGLGNLNEGAGGWRAMAVAVPCQSDAAGRDVVPEFQDRDPRVRGLDREARHQRHAHFRCYQPLDCPIVIRAEDDVCLYPTSGQVRLNPRHGAALTVADQGELGDIVERQWRALAGERRVRRHQ